MRIRKRAAQTSLSRAERLRSEVRPPWRQPHCCLPHVTLCGGAQRMEAERRVVMLHRWLTLSCLGSRVHEHVHRVLAVKAGRVSRVQRDRSARVIVRCAPAAAAAAAALCVCASVRVTLCVIVCVFLCRVI